MWFYCDAWGVPQMSDDIPCPPENIPDCFDLLHTGDHIYALSALTPAIQTNTNNCYTSGLINYVYVQFIRTLEIQPDGIVLSP